MLYLLQEQTNEIEKFFIFWKYGLEFSFSVRR